MFFGENAKEHFNWAFGRKGKNNYLKFPKTLGPELIGLSEPAGAAKAFDHYHRVNINTPPLKEKFSQILISWL